MTNDAADAATEEAPEEKSPSRTKQIVTGVVTLLVVLLVFGIVFPQFGDYGQAWEAIQDMSSAALVALVIATIVNILLYVLPYLAALPGLRYWPAFVVRQTSFMISNVVPAGGAFGLATQYGMLSSYGFAPAPTTAAIGITSVWNIFVTLALPVLAIIGLLLTGYTNAEAAVIAVVGLVVIGVLIGLFAYILKSDANARKLGELGDRIVAWFMGLFNKEIETSFGDAVVDFRDSIVDVVGARWPAITFTNLLQQLAQFTVLWLAVAGIQGSFTDPVTLAEAFAAFAFARLGTFIPITPGGLGTVDAILVAILSAFGLDNSQAMAADMVWRALTYFPQVFIGVGTLLGWGRWNSRRTKT